MNHLEHLIARLDAMATVCATYERRRTAAEASIVLKRLQTMLGAIDQADDAIQQIKESAYETPKV